MPHPAIAPGRAAVVTGGAAGIGFAIASRLAKDGMAVAILDLGEERLAKAKEALETGGAADVLTLEADVSDRAALERAAAEVTGALGTPTMLFANAGIQPGSAVFGPEEAWNRVLAVNLRGIVDTVRVFGPGMIERGGPGAIVCTGSKQGITTPPGDPAYNVAKAGVKAFAEALAHELRNTKGCDVTAHLLIPGFVFTELNAQGRTEKPAGAWTPEQMADFMFDSLGRGDFYILCPDNDVPRPLDEKRMAWAMGDIIENRPALSRWHPDWADAFADFVKKA
jgi:NAD(P)-dependent dehydrogenase (short-subunit alcohol dehydrogenase family)